MYTSTLALGLTALVSGVAQAQYTLDIAYDNSNFFTTWDFFTDADPTNGFVEYVDANTANAESLAGYVDGAIFMGVDTKTSNPANGRKSVRLTSQKAFTHGLFIADIAHMPGNAPGVWPAYWMFGPNWPASGEVDILEGVNLQQSNLMTLHTAPGCTITNEGTAAGTTLKTDDCGANSGYTGCTQSTSATNNYGDGFNSNGGGVYAVEWTSEHIAIWFFPRDSIPDSVNSDSPDVASWGQPTARFVGGQGCDIDSYFQQNNLVFDTTFCGDWAGADDVWNNDPELSKLGACRDYVGANPTAYNEAYWSVNSIKVYQQGGNSNGTVSTSPSATASATIPSPVTPSATPTPTPTAAGSPYAAAPSANPNHAVKIDVGGVGVDVGVQQRNVVARPFRA